jgi:hypothetical protein
LQGRKATLINPGLPLRVPPAALINIWDQDRQLIKTPVNR